MTTRPCEILYDSEYGFHRCGLPAEGMDSKGVLVCRGHGELRNMVGGIHVGWFADQPKRDAEYKEKIARATPSQRKESR